MGMIGRALASAVGGAAFFAVVLFLPAGTADYWQAWVFLAVFVATTLPPSAYLAVRYPDALRRRMSAGPTAEPRPVQRLIITLTFALGAATFVVAALDHRYGWSSVPPWAVIAGDVLVGAGLLLSQLVIVQNNYAAATVRVEDGQTVVTTGLYGVVRHPMYLGALIMTVGTPPALGSLWGWLGLVASVPVFVARILDEEALLRDGLAGYREYANEVRWRVLPGVW